MTTKPRKHNPKWKDSTRTQRSRDRVADLNAIAVLLGYPTWRKFETAVLRRYKKLLEERGEVWQWGIKLEKVTQ